MLNAGYYDAILVNMNADAVVYCKEALLEFLHMASHCEEHIKQSCNRTINTFLILLVRFGTRSSNNHLPIGTTNQHRKLSFIRESYLSRL